MTRASELARRPAHPSAHTRAGGSSSFLGTRPPRPQAARAGLLLTGQESNATGDSAMAAGERRVARGAHVPPQMALGGAR
jgi:hypothetical protein